MPRAEYRKRPDFFLTLLGGFVAIFSAGCAQTPFPKTEIRAVTSEVVAAAHDVTGRKSEISIRPEVQQSSSQLAADDIYISLGDGSRLTPLKQALAEIARHHRLSVVQTSAGDVTRLDFSFHGSRTHTIHIATPLTSRSRPPAPHAQGNPQLAIIIDDMGHDRASADALLALPFPLTISVMPHLPLSTEVAEQAYRRGDQVMLHLPMEPDSEDTGPEGAKPENIELRVGMNQEQVGSTLSGMLETVPHAAGVNNHEGSRATSDPRLMQELMPALLERRLFFIDSRTTAATVAYDVAESAGVPAASRKVFLDDAATREAILAQLEVAARDAERDGSAIAIGHPHPATIAALAESVPALEARGIRLVFASNLVH